MTDLVVRTASILAVLVMAVFFLVLPFVGPLP